MQLNITEKIAFPCVRLINRGKRNLNHFPLKKRGLGLLLVSVAKR